MNEPVLPNQTLALSQLASVLLVDMQLDEVLARVADIAKRAIPRAAEVSITLIDGEDAETAAYTGALALELDERQYRTGHGPCLDASRTGRELHIQDMTTETRWPDYTPKAAQAGALSSLSLPLPVGDDVIGALNIYGAQRSAFGEPDADIARVFAGHAAVALHNGRVYAASTALAAQMKQAMESRAVIEQAKGILMGQRRCSDDEAFQLLRRISQDTNRKLRDVAQALVDTAVRPAGPPHR
ncbi:MAG: hypothetical protein JWN61_667 [Pseudonocardiales bacterium]|nr:hypothetical protein [Pseudonocardiales bacterium]